MTVAQRASADRMIRAKGQAVTITRTIPGVYDPATGTVTNTTEVQQGRAVIFDFAPGLRKMAGTNIPATDRQCYLSALKVDGAPLTRPAVNDKLSDAASVDYTVIAVSELSPAALDIMYDLTIRGHA